MPYIAYEGPARGPAYRLRYGIHYGMRNGNATETNTYMTRTIAALAVPSDIAVAVTAGARINPRRPQAQITHGRLHSAIDKKHKGRLINQRRAPRA